MEKEVPVALVQINIQALVLQKLMKNHKNSDVNFNYVTIVIKKKIEIWDKSHFF